MQIKESLMFPFVTWMINGNHSLGGKGRSVVMKRNGKIAKIMLSNNDYLDMNDYCCERYALFLKQWFNNGVSFIEDLTKQGEMEIKKLRQSSYRELMK